MPGLSAASTMGTPVDIPPMGGSFGRTQSGEGGSQASMGASLATNLDRDETLAAGSSCQ
jgi:hypothetical protein